MFRVPMHFPVRMGDSGIGVKQLQEFLSLAGYKIKIDSDFGSITLDALNQVQKRFGFESKDSLDELLFYWLARKFFLLDGILPPFMKLSHENLLREAILWLAWQAVDVNAREVGGQNMGPWVRYFMGGYEGRPYAWCAGFATNVVLEAGERFHVPDEEMPFTKVYWGCTQFAKDMTIADRLGGDDDMIRRGDLFLIPSSPGNYSHVGIVASQDQSGRILTIEGNSNDEGSYEGYEACIRSRSSQSVHIVNMRLKEK